MKDNNSSILATEKGAKNSSSDYNTDQEKLKSPSNSKKGIRNYIKSRPRNTVLFIILIFINKALLHYIFFPLTSRNITIPSDGGLFSSNTYGTPYRRYFGEHLKAMFTEELMLFPVSILILALIVWYFADKIKAR